jgi:hypothetical protein
LITQRLFLGRAWPIIGERMAGRKGFDASRNGPAGGDDPRAGPLCEATWKASVSGLLYGWK